MRPLVIAHRGASWDEPENTLPAFRRAIEVGADYVEVDVRATRDGRLVAVHDHPRPSRAYPTLSEVLEVTAGRIGVMIELKHPSRYRRHDVVRRTLELVDDDVVIVSFEREALRSVQRLRPGMRCRDSSGRPRPASCSPPPPARCSQARSPWPRGGSSPWSAGRSPGVTPTSRGATASPGRPRRRRR